MSDLTWQLKFRPMVRAMLQKIPEGTPEKEVRRLVRGKGPQDTSWLPKIWSRELNLQLDGRFDRARFKNLGPSVEVAANQLPLL